MKKQKYLTREEFERYIEHNNSILSKMLNLFDDLLGIIHTDFLTLTIFILGMALLVLILK